MATDIDDTKHNAVNLTHYKHQPYINQPTPLQMVKAKRKQYNNQMGRMNSFVLI